MRKIDMRVKKIKKENLMGKELCIGEILSDLKGISKKDCLIKQEKFIPTIRVMCLSLKQKVKLLQKKMKKE